MEILKFTNSYGDQITLGGFSDEYILISRGDIGGTAVSNVTETGYLQRGTSIIQKSLAATSQIIVVGIKGATSTSFKSKMNKLSRFFDIEYTESDDVTPFKMSIDKLGYETKEMDIFIQRTPTLLNSGPNGDSSLNYQRAMFTLLMPEPVWKDENYSNVLMESQDDLFSFPLNLTDIFVFATLNSDGVDVINLGDVSTSVIIEFTGLSTNPIITNEAYGESLKLLTTIAAGDVVTIDTDYNNPTVSITSGGVTTNAFKYIDPDNNNLNMTLRRGDNFIKYTSDDATQTTATMKYKNKWMTPFSGVIE